MTSMDARPREIDTALWGAKMKLTRLNLCSTCSDRNVNFLLDRTKTEYPFKISLSHHGPCGSGVSVGLEGPH